MKAHHRNKDSNWHERVAAAVQELMKRKGDDVASIAKAMPTSFVGDHLADIAEGKKTVPIHIYRTAIHELSENVYPLADSRDPNDKVTYKNLRELHRTAPLPRRSTKDALPSSLQSQRNGGTSPG